jgi:hypothetical protein
LGRRLVAKGIDKSLTKTLPVLKVQLVLLELQCLFLKRLLLPRELPREHRTLLLHPLLFRRLLLLHERGLLFERADAGVLRHGVLRHLRDFRGILKDVGCWYGSRKYLLVNLVLKTAG